MNSKIKSLLLPFYFGSIADNERTVVERELLVDSEILLDYLDLKRSLEKAALIPSEPSPAVWQSLRQRVARRKKMWISVSLGTAVTLALVFLVIFFKPTAKEAESVLTPQPSEEILFDSSGEPSSTLNVL